MGNAGVDFRAQTGRSRAAQRQTPPTERPVAPPVFVVVVARRREAAIKSPANFAKMKSFRQPSPIRPPFGVTATLRARSGPLYLRVSRATREEKNEGNSPRPFIHKHCSKQKNDSIFTGIKTLLSPRGIPLSLNGAGASMMADVLLVRKYIRNTVPRRGGVPLRDELQSLRHYSLYCFFRFFLHRGAFYLSLSRILRPFFFSPLAG